MHQCVQYAVAQLWYVLYCCGDLEEPSRKKVLYVSIENYQSFMLSWSFYADASVLIQYKVYWLTHGFTIYLPWILAKGSLFINIYFELCWVHCFLDSKWSLTKTFYWGTVWSVSLYPVILDDIFTKYVNSSWQTRIWVVTYLDLLNT